MYPRTLSISQQIALKNQTTPSSQPISTISQPAVVPTQSHQTRNREVQRTACALGSQAVNTHFFDGKLPSFTSSLIDDNVAREIESDISRAALVTKEDKTQCFNELEEKVRNYALTKKIPPHSLKYLREIISTHDRFGRVTSYGNYDSINKLHACDLLYLLYEKIMSEEEPEYMRLMLEQLDEMSTGPCPQGRCCRLFQAFVMLRDDLTPTSKPIE
jgi:hypothetical protein